MQNLHIWLALRTCAVAQSHVCVCHISQERLSRLTAERIFYFVEQPFRCVWRFSRDFLSFTLISLKQLDLFPAAAHGSATQHRGETMINQSDPYRRETACERCRQGPDKVFLNLLSDLITVAQQHKQSASSEMGPSLTTNYDYNSPYRSLCFLLLRTNHSSPTNSLLQEVSCSVSCSCCTSDIRCNNSRGSNKWAEI